MLIEELHDAPSPADACARLLDLPFPLLLESAARGGSMGRYSYLTADPSQIWTSTRATTRTRSSRRPRISRPIAPTRYRACPPFQGGVAGFLGYEFGRRLERLPAPRSDDLGPARCLAGRVRLGGRVGSLEGRAWVLAEQRGSGASGDVAARHWGEGVRRKAQDRGIGWTDPDVIRA